MTTGFVNIFYSYFLKILIYFIIDNISNFTEFSQFNSSLTCIIFGDPHLRTLDGHFETCKCQGAWPLIDHPLFAVQITNSRNIKRSFL